MYPHSGDSITRRDYMTHRLGATVQCLRFLESTISHYQTHYQKIGTDTGEKLHASFDAINQVSYCFDNLIFNLASLSDYFGNYLGLFLYGPKNQTLKWNGFVNKVTADNSDDDFLRIVANENKYWFTKLHSYRGDIIHRKAILVEINGFNNTLFMPHTVDEFTFTINDSLKKYFHIFRNSKENEILYCAKSIWLKTIESLTTILDASENVIFDEMHKKTYIK